MTEGEGQQERKLREALHRYVERYEPVQPEWRPLYGALADVRRRGGRQWRYAWLPAMAVTAMAIVVALLVLRQPETTSQVAFVDPGAAVAPGSQPVRAPRSQPATPRYQPVTPAPVFAPGTTMAAIQARGVLKVGISFDRPAFGLQDPRSGELYGFDAEIAKLLGAGIFGGSPEALGDRIQFVETKSPDRETALQQGTVDIVVATYTITDDRRQLVDFAGPYFRARQDIMVRAGDTAIRGVADLRGATVCTVRGTTSHRNLLARAPDAQVLLKDAYSKCAQALLDRQVDAVTTDEAILAGYLLQSRNAFKLVNNPFSDEPYGVGLKKGDEPFRTFLNTRLHEITTNGDWTVAAGYSLSGIQVLRPPPLDRP